MSTRKCLEFQSELNAAVEKRAAFGAPFVASGGELPATVQSHLAECPACRALWQQHQLLDRAIGEWRAGLPEVDLADRILASVRNGSPDSICGDESIGGDVSAGEAVSHVAEIDVAAFPARRNSSRSPLRRSSGQKLVVAVAAMSLVALVIVSLTPVMSKPRRPAGDGPANVAGTSGRNGNSGNPNDRTANDRNPNDLKLPDDGPSPDRDSMAVVDIAHASPAEAELPVATVNRLPDESRLEVSGLVRDVGTAYLSLAGNAAASVRSAAPLVPSDELPLLRPASRREANADRPPMAEETPRGRTPWGRNLGRALDFLWDSIPADESPAT